MANWINKLYEQLLDSLDDIYDIEDLNMALESISVFEQTHLNEAQLQDTDIMERMQELYDQTPNYYLKYRLRQLLRMWRDVIQPSRQHKVRRLTPDSVFEAVIKDDDHFFRTKSVPELLHRLLKSFDKNYKVILNSMRTLM